MSERFQLEERERARRAPVPVLGATAIVTSASALAAIVMLATSMQRVDSPPAIDVEPHAFPYRLAGEFSKDGVVVDAPLIKIRSSTPLHIMTHQVTDAEFDRCVMDRGCAPRSRVESPGPTVPAAQVNWQDATSYATWLSAKTGENWKLPTDEEWAFAAGSRFHDDALALAASRDPASRWLARYDKESEGAAFEGRLRSVGGFGPNEYGVLDLSGNVWEWTNTCFIRQRLDAKGEPVDGATVNCGVRVVEGEHRTYMTDFVRDPRSGGCTLGKPPTHLGFRLVRESRFNVATGLAWLKAALRL